MEVIQCTKKLQKEIGIKASDLFEGHGDSFLGPWHANLIYILRRKCVLFANNRTYFSFLAVDVSRAEMRDMQGLFSSWLRAALEAHSIKKHVIEKILDDYSCLKVAKSSDRRVLGVMNDLAFNYTFSFERTGSITAVDFPEVLRIMNRMPSGALNYGSPIEALLKEIGPQINAD